jgi:hypothetical protein
MKNAYWKFYILNYLHEQVFNQRRLILNSYLILIFNKPLNKNRLNLQFEVEKTILVFLVYVKFLNCKLNSKELFFF